MKKLMGIFASALLASCFLCACGAKENVQTVSKAETEVKESSAVETVASEETKEESDELIVGGKIIVGSDVATIEEAVNKAGEGTVIFLPKGTYEEFVYLDKDGVTLMGEEGTVIDASGKELSDDESVAIEVSGTGIRVEGIEVKNLLIEGPSDVCPIGIKVDKGSKDITIKNCKVHDLGFIYDFSSDDDNYNAHGIYVSGGVDKETTNILVDGCELYNLHLGSSESLVFNGNVVGFEASNNYIHDCDNIGIDAIGYEQDEDNENDSARNGKIHGNFVKNINSDPSVNPTYDSPCADGIYVDGGRDIEIYDNFVINCNIGIEVASEHQGKVTSGINVHDNSLAFNNDWAGICIGGYDPEETGTAKGCTIKNNIVYNTDLYCLVVQYACDESNVIEGNTFIAEEDGIAYGDEFEELSRGNTIKGNSFTIDMAEFGYPDNTQITVKAVTVNEDSRTITIQQ
ncbi:MAG: hypothetical protein IK121_00290 [Lachnospiraceae bacterium]|nr:hypothetical protein [Lachnospiraceae bacterium]